MSSSSPVQSPTEPGLVVTVIDDHAAIGLGIQQIFAVREPSATVYYHSTISEMRETPDVIILDLRLADKTTPPPRI